MKTYKENMEDHADSLLLLTRDDWNLNNRSEMLYHIKQLQSHIKDIGELVPCDCGSDDASWHGRTRREYCCDKCYSLSPTRESNWEWVEE